METSTKERKECRGFAGMTREKHREICAKGGRRAHEKGTAHEWKVGEQATRDAGRKGGFASNGGRGKTKLVETPEPDEQTAA